MQWELRIYRPKPGGLETFVREWREHVLPLRRERGFQVVGPWVTDDGRFVWIVGHDDLRRADEAYYASPERGAFDPDPARLIDDAQHLRMTEL
jgi:NIPSNAP